MATTIRDVARRANVSIATVSLVMHNSARISEQTNARVHRAIKELNFHPSRSARGLVSKKTGNIGFILTEDHFLRSEPFYTHIFIGAEFEARKNDYYLLLTTIPSNYKKEDRLPRFVLERNVDAIIIAGKVSDEFIQNLERFKLPIAFVDYYPAARKYPAVMIDNQSGGRVATEYLLSLGHRNIAFIAGDITHPSISERFQGYKIAFESRQLKVSSNMYVIDEDYPARTNGYNAARRLFEQNPETTAIFACNDAMALGVIQFLKEKQLRIPDGISVIGFDDVEVGQSTDPPLTTVEVPKFDMGVEVMRLCSELLGGSISTNKKVLVPVKLIERKSTGSI